MDNQSEIVLGEAVSSNYASVLGVKAALGRWFTPQDKRLAGGEFLAVISYGVWQRRFGADPQVVGKKVRLELQQYTIICVAPKEFEGTFAPYTTDLWAPAVIWARHNKAIAGLLQNQDSTMLVLGRLKPGVAPQQAQAFINTLDRQLRAC